MRQRIFEKLSDLKSQINLISNVLSSALAILVVVEKTGDIKKITEYLDNISGIDGMEFVNDWRNKYDR